MRELLATGYMPNYMRHVVAGFLIEFLSIDWRHGELWFHDNLVDADVAIQAGWVLSINTRLTFNRWNTEIRPFARARLNARTMVEGSVRHLEAILCVCMSILS